jgi:hypothetical protein
MTIFCSRFAIAILGGLLSVPSLHGAKAAPCSAGDLAGSWSMYASHYLKPTNVQPTVMRCNVTLTKTDNSPIKYNMSGNCLDYQTSADIPISLEIQDGHVVENANTCKLTGSFKIGASFLFPTATIIDARIESSGNPKKHIAGIARVFTGSDNYHLLDFKLVR